MIAIATGPDPTVIGSSAVLVAVRNGTPMVLMPEVQLPVAAPDLPTLRRRP